MDDQAHCLFSVTILLDISKDGLKRAVKKGWGYIPHAEVFVKSGEPFRVYGGIGEEVMPDPSRPILGGGVPILPADSIAHGEDTFSSVLKEEGGRSAQEEVPRDDVFWCGGREADEGCCYVGTPIDKALNEDPMLLGREEGVD